MGRKCKAVGLESETLVIQTDSVPADISSIRLIAKRQQNKETCVYILI